MNFTRILSQGVMDGSCFLYSVANAYKQLTYPEMAAHAFSDKMEEKWKAIVRTAPSWLCNLSGEGTDFRIKSDSIENAIFLDTIRRCFDIFDDEKRKFSIGFITKKAFVKKKDYSNSVVLFCSKSGMKSKAYVFDSDYHWSCVTGRAKCSGLVCVACSYVMHYGNPCAEHLGDSQKSYNNLFDISQFTERKMFYDSFIEIEPF